MNSDEKPRSVHLPVLVLGRESKGHIPLLVTDKRLHDKSQAAQAHYVWVRASEVIWSEYTRVISVLSDVK